jgi:hypothetical protein
MNPIDDQLNRLLRAAQRAPVPEVAPPFGLEARVLAAWREAGSDTPGFWDGALLVRGLICAAAIMTICLVPALTAISTSAAPFADTEQLNDSVVVTEESL